MSYPLFHDKQPIKVCITGVAGNIAYNLLPMIAGGRAFGKDQPVFLHLLEHDNERSLGRARGVAMELDDSVYPLLAGYTVTGDPAVAFNDIDFAVLVGAMPRKDGMTRADLLLKNRDIFIQQGKAINACAKDTCRVLVVGNPVNTNAAILGKYASKLPRGNITAMSRLDHNRTIAQAAMKLGVPFGLVRNAAVFGNHSPTMVPCVDHAQVATEEGWRPLLDSPGVDEHWVESELMPTVRTRGGTVIRARGRSSASSAANAIVNHLHSWLLGTRWGEFVSASLLTDELGSPYGVPAGLCFSFPCRCRDGKWEVVELPVSSSVKEGIAVTIKELQEEMETALGDIDE
eukprot:gnl/Dysnectes_brevis/2834_a3459_1696.p1 GENE.gnl/Dysnectes_brevis/2834_a3459_1696~~gnl/Dysnectes_brevis/2834_a3459_1696.p1  ORF type:complete len:352 (+),score=86.04 gnl/Dysnectes_brevis/2834_a3459_1696:24-1058(+)